MIKITSTNDVIIVEGDELTRHYPYNGTLVIPKNSTLLLLDESSEMVLFKSASNYDTLFTGILGSISIEDEIVTRENIIEKFNAISNVIQGGGNVDLFEVVQSLPTENISDKKVYLVLDSNGSEGNTYVEYLYVNGQWEELGKFKVNVDLSGYATEQWVNEQGFLKEHQDISNLATKAELATKQDTISDLDTIRMGAAKGATALQSVPSTYAKKTDILTAKTDTRYTTFEVQNPALSGKTIILQNEATDSRKYHTFGFDKTYSTTSSNGLLNGSTPLYRNSNEYNCPQWDGNTIRFTYQEGNEVYTTLTIPYTYNGIKYVTHICTNVYNDSVRMVPYPYIDDDNFPDYQIVQFKDSEIYNTYRSNGTFGIDVNGEMQNYDSEPNSPTNFSSTVMPGYTVEITVRNFPLNASNGELEIETPRFYLSSNNVLTGDVPTEEETSNAPERLNDYIRYANNVKAYILTDKNTTFKTINGEQITGNGDITIDTNVDLSNYATKSELNTKQDVINDLDTIRSGAALGATALQSVPSEYATEQWVNEQGFLKEHQDISNLATKDELNAKQDVINDLETIRSGAAKGATALQSVPDTYALKTDIPDITTKQDTLVSGTNIKTVNGTSLLGSGNIEVDANVDLSDYYTKSETNSLVNPKLEQVTLTQAEYNALSTKEENVLYIISDAEDIKFKTINGEQITGEGNIELATKSELATKQDIITDLETIRSGAALGATALQSVPSGYATEQWVNSQGFLKEHQDISNLATKTELSTKQDTLVSGTNIKTVNGISILGEGNITISGADLSGYYTKAEIDSMIGGASETITQINNLVV